MWLHARCSSRRGRQGKGGDCKYLSERVSPEERGEDRAGLGLAPREILGDDRRDERHRRPARVRRSVARQQSHEPHILLAPYVIDNALLIIYNSEILFLTPDLIGIISLLTSSSAQDYGLLVGHRWIISCIRVATKILTL